MAVRPTFFTNFSEDDPNCFTTGSSRGGILLHEMTHMPWVKGTKDYRYSWDAYQYLSLAQNLDNTDTYRHFARGKSMTIYHINKD
jgi:hypothetical protein